MAPKLFETYLDISDDVIGKSLHTLGPLGHYTVLNVAVSPQLTHCHF